MSSWYGVVVSQNQAVNNSISRSSSISGATDCELSACDILYDANSIYLLFHIHRWRSRDLLLLLLLLLAVTENGKEKEREETWNGSNSTGCTSFSLIILCDCIYFIKHVDVWLWPIRSCNECAELRVRRIPLCLVCCVRAAPHTFSLVPMWLCKDTRMWGKVNEQANLIAYVFAIPIYTYTHTHIPTVKDNTTLWDESHGQLQIHFSFSLSLFHFLVARLRTHTHTCTHISTHNAMRWPYVRQENTNIIRI